MGPHCDIYALGATLYNLFTGEKVPSPFEILQNGLPKIPNASSLMQNAINKSMAVMVKDRIRNIAEFRREIGLLGDAPTAIGIGGDGTVVARGGDDDTTIVAPSESESSSVVRPIKNLKSFTETVNGVSFKMIAVEGGTFKMGDQSKDQNKPNFDKDAARDESLVHDVALDSFYMAEFVVTEDLWEAVMNEYKSKGFLGRLFGNAPREGYPKTMISWNDCQEFINKLNQLTGKNFRLPTEAEWEYAARGGNKSRGYKYSGSNNISDVAWYRDNSSCATHPVCIKSPNELGIYDMSGNVWEWCSDWYGKRYYSSSPSNNPPGPTSGSGRVIRGGSWSGIAQGCRVANRGYNTPVYRYDSLGLRLVCASL